MPRSVLAVYKHMDRTSKDGEWQGFGKEIADEISIKLNVVYRSIGMLENLGCIKRMRHGANKAPSIYRLIKEPDGAEYQQLKAQSIMTGRLEMPSQAQRVQDSITRLRSEVNSLTYEVGQLRVRLERLEHDRHDVRRSA